jgi:hypothetical protein
MLSQGVEVDTFLLVFWGKAVQSPANVDNLSTGDCALDQSIPLIFTPGKEIRHILAGKVAKRSIFKDFFG